MVPGQPQPDRRGLDRSAAAARCPGRAASAGLCRRARPTRSARRSPRPCAEAKQDAAVLTDPASIAWLLNIRGGDVPFTPFALGFALVHADGAHRAVHGPGQAARRRRAPGWATPCRWRGATRWRRRAGAAGWQAGAGRSGRLAGLVRPDAARGGRHGGGRAGPVPAAEGVQERDGAAGRPRCPCARCGGGVPVPALARRGGAGRRGDRDVGGGEAAGAAAARWRGSASESFPAISGAGEHGAIIHYRVTAESNRPVRANEVYLIDSGAQYPDGTTDITRTVWTGPDAPPAELRGTGDAGAEGAHRHRHAGVPAGRRRRAPGRLRPARAVAGRAGLRPWHRPRRRQLSVGARGAGQPVPAGAAGADRARA